MINQNKVYIQDQYDKYVQEIQKCLDEPIKKDKYKEDIPLNNDIQQVEIVNEDNYV